MTRLFALGGACALALLTSGCITQAGRDAVGPLPEFKVSVERSPCSKLLEAVEVQGGTPITLEQAKALYKACEDRDAESVVKVRPETLRRGVPLP